MEILGVEQHWICYRYPTPRAAKLAWERVAKRVRNISVNRLAESPGDSEFKGPQIVIVMGDDLASVERAGRLMQQGGEQIEPHPDWVSITYNNRLSNAILEGGKRTIIRTPLGKRVTPEGIDLGPARRPQG
jgi:hypothetical protein